MSEIRYCANSCTRRHGDRTDPATTYDGSNLCNQCETRLEKWLRAIPDTYALVPLFIEHGSTPADPDGIKTKNSNAQAPMRLDAIDLLDTRRGRIWNGTEPTTDRRGVIGILQPWIDWLRTERPLTTITTITVTSACELLLRHRLWIAEQEIVPDFYEDIRKLHRALSDSIGDYRPKPVGRCTNITEDTETPCGGPLYPQDRGGVSCTKCHEHTKEEHLRILGAALTESESA